MRLIDADALLLEIGELKKSPWFNDDSYPGSHAVRKEAVEIVEDLCIKDAPTIDRPQGEWIEVCKRTEQYDREGVKTWAVIYQCSTCGFVLNAIENHTAQYNYCPNCGARMDGAE